jgi:hypothetical protein
MEKQNRAERRKNKFGGGRASDHGGWPTHQPNPVFEAETTGQDVATPAEETSKADPVAEPAKSASTKPPV